MATKGTLFKVSKCCCSKWFNCMFGPVKGHRHDSGMLASSGLLQLLETISQDTAGQALCVYGDPAYLLQVCLQGPFKAMSLSPLQQAFNLSMSRIRVAVEWVFYDILICLVLLILRKIWRWVSVPLARFICYCHWQDVTAKECPYLPLWFNYFHLSWHWSSIAGAVLYLDSITLLFPEICSQAIFYEVNNNYHSHNSFLCTDYIGPGLKRDVTFWTWSTNCFNLQFTIHFSPEWVWKLHCKQLKRTIMFQQILKIYVKWIIRDMESGAVASVVVVA